MLPTAVPQLSATWMLHAGMTASVHLAANRSHTVVVTAAHDAVLHNPATNSWTVGSGIRHGSIEHTAGCSLRVGAALPRRLQPRRLPAPAFHPHALDFRPAIARRPWLSTMCVMWHSTPMASPSSYGRELSLRRS